MKWIVLNQTSLPDSMRNDNRHFNVIPVPKSANRRDFDSNLPSILEQILKEQFVDWVTFEDLPKLGKTARRKYEIFCGGFLYYHDEEFKKYNKEFEHRIFFEWVAVSKEKQKLRIHINFTPQQFNANPPPPPKPPPPES